MYVNVNRGCGCECGVWVIYWFYCTEIIGQAEPVPTFKYMLT